MGAGLRTSRAAMLGFVLGVASLLVALSTAGRAVAAPSTPIEGPKGFASASALAHVLPPPRPTMPATPDARDPLAARDDGLARRAARFAAILDEACRRLGDGPEQARRAKAILLVAALHESNGFRSRVQGDLGGDGSPAAGGPARGLLQMEPATFADLWRHARDDWRAALAEAAGVPLDALAAEAARIDAAANAWGDSAVRVLLEANDLFAALAARCDMKRSPEPLDPAVDPLVEIDGADRCRALAEAWFRWVKKACGRGQCRDELIALVAEKARALDPAVPYQACALPSPD